MKVARFAKVSGKGPHCQLEFIKESLARSAFTVVVGFLRNGAGHGWVCPTPPRACGWLQGSLSSSWAGSGLSARLPFRVCETNRPAAEVSSSEAGDCVCVCVRALCM